MFRNFSDFKKKKKVHLEGGGKNLICIHKSGVV